MAAKFTTEGSEMYEQRPAGIVSDRVRNEVGTTESGNAGNIPNSTVNLTYTNNIFFISDWFVY